MTEVEPMSNSGVYRPFPAFAEWEFSTFDTADFDRYSTLLSNAKKSATTESLDAAMTSAKRYAAIDTGAIEGLYTVDRGFTRTIATQAAAWEALMESRGPQVRPAFDDALSAYEYVLDAATQSVDVSEIWIKELHQIICASQDKHRVFTSNGSQDQPLPKGRYKSMPNSPTLPNGRIHAYAPVADTAPEMYRLICELRSESFLAAHPVAQAAYAHYAYVCIHPFADGNGRVARALASIYLYRSPGVPLIIFADQRNDYYDALESADGGDPSQFLRFIMIRTIDSIGIIRSMLQKMAPPVASSVAGLQALFNSDADTHVLAAAASRLRNMCIAEARRQIAALQLPPQLSVTVSANQVQKVEEPHGYYGLGNNGSWWAMTQSSWPHDIQVIQPVSIFIRSNKSAVSDFVMKSNDSYDFEVWLRELDPVETESLKLKVTGFVESVVGALLAETEEKVKRGGAG